MAILDEIRAMARELQRHLVDVGAHLPLEVFGSDVTINFTSPTTATFLDGASNPIALEGRTVVIAQRGLVLQPSTYTVAANGLSVTFAAAPGGAVPVVWLVSARRKTQ